MSLPGIVDVPAAVKPTRRELIIAVAGTVVRLILGFVLIAFALTLEHRRCCAPI